MTEYPHLTVKPPFRWWVRYRLAKATAHFLERAPLVAKLSRYVGYKLIHFANVGANYKASDKNVGLLEKNEETANRVGSPYGYNEIMELETVLTYHSQLMDKNFENVRSESPALYREAVNTLGKLFKSDPEVTSMLDFGVALGHMNSILARQFERVKFFGIDRSPLVKACNEVIYSDVKNLFFEAGDVFDLIRLKDFKSGVLFHARTILILPPSFVKKLYAEVYKAGFKYIVGFEQIGVSRQTNKPYAFSDEPKPSLHYRSFMTIHNYPALLKEAGFKVEEIDLVKTNHPHEDLRIVKFVAKRV